MKHFNIEYSEYVIYNSDGTKRQFLGLLGTWVWDIPEFGNPPSTVDCDYKREHEKPRFSGLLGTRPTWVLEILQPGILLHTIGAAITKEKHYISKCNQDGG